MYGKTMAPYLQLDLNSFIIDVQLALRVPYTLSRYYLALPIGQDNGSVSVAMAYPDNVKARQVLSHLLHAKVVPVFTPAESLLPVLKRIYSPENREQHAILAWYEQPEWETPVKKAATMLSDTYQAKITTLTAPDFSLDEVLSLAALSPYEVVVLPAPSKPMLSTVLNQAAKSLFFVRGEQQMIKRILVVMRGFASDERALAWLTPFAWCRQATVTLMPLTNGSGLGLSQYDHRESLAGSHLHRCLQQLQTEGITVNLKYRRGNAIQQVVEEVTGNTYDLLVLAAEAEGDFVSQVITAVNQHNAHYNRPIFVLKPPELAASQATHSNLFIGERII
jgi:hypothetical protein